ncbi:hypothetical protein EYR38_006522 [Pleurotus pulmonarius]|nr:hypothetical protein EYR38_006522 [Pleurotus pulmonarius]
MSNPFGEKRTRSQLVLPDLDFSLQQSPMKNAKTMAKNSQQPSTSDLKLPEELDMDTPKANTRQMGGSDMDMTREDSDDELLLSPGKTSNSRDLPHNGNSGVKRPPSPTHHDSYTGRPSGSVPPSPSVRHSKRARRGLEVLEVLGETLNTKMQDGERTVRASSEPRVLAVTRKKRKRSATPSSTKPESLASSSSRPAFEYEPKSRASSVPLFPTTFNPILPDVPHYDLRNLPPSPRRPRSRSPSKEREPKLRIFSNPILPSERLEAIPDETLMEVDQVPQSHSDSTLLAGIERDSMSPLTDPPSPVTPPPATSSPDIPEVPPQIESIIEEVNGGPSLFSNNLMDLSPLTSAHSSSSTPSPIQPLATLPVAEAPTVVEQPPAIQPAQPETSIPTTRQRAAKGKSRLPRPSSIVDLPSAASSQHAKPDVKLPSSKATGKARAVNGVAGPSKTTAAPAKPNAFSILMAGGKSKTNDAPKPRGRPSKASTQLAKNSKPTVKPDPKPAVVPEKPKVTLKSKMRPREKPKPVLVVPASLFPPESAEQSDEDALPKSKTPSPVLLAHPINEPESVANQELAPDPDPDPGPAPSPLGISLFTPPVVVSPDDMIIEEGARPTEEGAQPTEEGAQPIEEGANLVSPDATEQRKEDAEPDPLPELESVHLEKEIPASSTVHITTSPASNESSLDVADGGPTESVVVEPLAPPPSSSPSRKRKKGLPRSSIPETSPRRVTRSTFQQQKLDDKPDVGAPLTPQESSSSVDKVIQPPIATEGVNPTEDADAMVISAPTSPEKQAGPSRRSLGRASKIPLPKTPAKASAPKRTYGSPSPSKLARASSMYLPRAGATGPSSLSNLSDALDKLRMPPPARPNTSMGFNRDADDNDDEDPTKTVDDFAINRRTSLSRAATLDTSALASKALSKTNAPGKKATNSLVQKPMTNFFGVRPGGKVGERSSILSKPGSGPRIFGFGRGRAAPKASKKTTLPSVMHSPVKGDGNYADDGSDNEIEVSNITPRATEISTDVFMAPPVPREDVDEDMAIILDTKEKDSKKKDAWSKNASRRASLAFQGLSQSLSSLPKPSAPGLMGPPATPKGTRSASSTYPVTAASESGEASGTENNTPPSGRVTRSSTAKTAPGALGKIKGGTGGHVSSGRKDAESSETQAKADSLSILDDCIVFLDVRTDEGEDAGELFLEMLQRLGARILSSVGSTCTHVVYKNGLTSTVNKWRKLKNKPHVVGIAWVVECAERKEKADETPHLIDLDGVNVAGVVKRRRSMLPRFIARELEEENAQQNADKEGNDDANKSSSSIVMEDDLPPLEIIRRRTMGIVT